MQNVSPGEARLKKLRMVMGMWYFMAGSVVRGCSTLAPKYDSSHASWYVMEGRHTASGTWGEG